MDSGGSVVDEADIVSDGHLDVCMRSSGEKMKSEASGRKKFQKSNLETAGGGSNLSYNPDKDSNATPSPKLPSENELIATKTTTQYLEVGLVFGKDPGKYLTKGIPRNKNHEQEMEKRGLLPRDEFAMRVFTPMTDTIKMQAKFYVVCKSLDGRPKVRVVKAETVFFYPEFWAGIDHLPTALPKHPSTTTAPNDLAPKVRLLDTMYKATGDDKYLAVAMAAIKKANGSGLYGPQTSTEGVDAFLVFGEELTQELASKASEGLRTELDLDVEPKLLLALNGEMMTMGPEVQHQVESRTLGFFLRLFVRLTGGEISQASIRAALVATELYGKSIPYGLEQIKITADRISAAAAA
ncbi:hypothetical protein SCUCBS95973_006188 [Sporothrix curviconia]|uniref:Uncharacterized protein n=1 Tax=Sporothrix curviconia TaxID=1260050 RepID=A0ABP0C340_9PEZI